MKKGFTSQKATPQGVLPGISWFLNKALLLFLLVSGMAFLTGQAWGQTFTTPGTHYVTVAPGQTVTLEAWGGGGAGGGATTPTGLAGLFDGAHCGAGGGGGAYATYVYTNASGSTVTLVITVGSGGTANSGAAGGSGGYSSVQIDAGSGPGTAVVRADGGSGGNANTSGGTPTGGAAGNGSIGTIVSGSNGGNGATGWTASTGAGGNGGNGGAGGPGFDGFGVTQDGNPGTQPGGGGSGARSSFANPGTTTGGAGGAGQVVVTAGSASCTNGILTLITAGKDNQMLCGPGPIETIEYVISGGATGVNVTGISYTGIIATFDSPTKTLTLTGTASGTINYTVNTVGTATPCTEATMTGTITVNDVPEVTDATMQASTDEAAWSALTGNFTDGFSLCLDELVDYYYLDLNSLTSSIPVQTGFMNGFTLVPPSSPGAFWDYWDAKGVNSSASSPTWQYYMWQIINGSLPMFYILDDAGDFKLIDGLQYAASGGTLTNTLRVNGDYPAGTYTFSGTVRDEEGCPTESFNVTITFNTLPTLDLTSDSPDRTVCEDFAIDPSIIYTFGGGATSATLTFEGSGLYGTVSGTEFIIKGTPDQSGTYTVTTFGAGVPCEDVSLSGYITVILTPEVTLTGGTDSQTVCQLVDEITPIVYTFAGGAEGLAITWGGIGASGLTFTKTADDAYTISGSPTDYGTINYEVYTTGMEPCEAATATGTITVIEKPILILTSSPTTDEQELCGPGTIIDITYYWNGGANQINVDGLNLEPDLHVSFTDNPDGGQDIRIYGWVSDDVNYTLYTGGAVAPCENITVTGTITVWDLPVTPTISGDDPVCAESTATYTTESGMHDYDWHVTGGSFVGGTDTNIVTVEWGTGAVGTLTVTYKDIHDCSPLSAGLLEVDINPLPLVSFGFNEVEAGHNPVFSYCYPTELTVDLHHIYAGTAPFSVTYNVDGGTATTVTGLGEHGVIGVATLEPGLHTITVTDVVDANGCHANAEFLSWCVATVEIYESPMVSFGFNGMEAGHNASFTYCYDEVIDVTIFAKYAGTESYTVYYNIDGGATVSFTGNVGDLIASQTLAPGTHTITVTDLVDGNGCSASAEYLSWCVATIHINPEPLVSFAFNGEEAGWNDSFTFCENDVIDVTLFKNYQGTAPFTVIYNIDGGASVTVTALDEGDLVGSSSTLGVGTHTITVENIIDANGCTASDEFLGHCVCTIEIKPDATLVLEEGSGAKEQWICLGQNIEPIIFRINGGATGFDLSVIDMGSLNVEGDIDGDDLVVTLSGTTSETVSYLLMTDGTDQVCSEESASIKVWVNYVPTFTVCSPDIEKNTDPGMCSAVATYEAVAVGSVSPVITYSYTINLATGGTVTGTGTGSGFAFPVGTSTVTVVATNSCGSAECKFTVKVTDNQIPQITCKSGNATTDPGKPTYTVTTAGWDPDVDENCTYTLTNSKTGGATLSGTTFPIGTTQVIWTVTDASGNAASCVSSYTIADNELPVIACTIAGTVTMTSDPGQCYYKVKGSEFDIASSSDNSGIITKYYKIGTGAWVQANSLVNYQFYGTTLVTWKVEDPSGNKAECSFTVVVTDDQKPVFEGCGDTFCVTLKPTIVRNRFGVFISATGYLYDSQIRPLLSDNCPGQITWWINRSTTFTDKDGGANLVKIYFHDAAGNKDSCCIIIDVPLPFKNGQIGGQLTEGDVYSDLNMNIYPNPTRGKLFIDIQNLNNPRVIAKVYSATGAMVLNREYTTDRMVEIDLTGNVSGMYMLQITADERQFTHKIILDNK